VTPSVRTRLIGPVVRAGARAGQFLPPQHWRRLSGPLIERLHHRGDVARPKLTPEQRVALRPGQRSAGGQLPTRRTGADTSRPGRSC